MKKKILIEVTVAVCDPEELSTTSDAVSLLDVDIDCDYSLLDYNVLSVEDESND